MFIFAGVYDSLQDAEDDFAAVKALHSGGMIGSYDSVILSKSEDGKVKVTKTEKPTQHGAWIGLAAGAAVAIAAPVNDACSVLGGRRCGPRCLDRSPGSWLQPRRCP